jgi:Abortive infection C-terminus
MSDLTNTEKRSLERMLGMGSGYVLDFSNRTFDEFVTDSVGKSIYDSKYDYGSGSKANRLRGFWSVEPNHIVGKLLKDLVIYASELYSPPDASLLEASRRIAHRLLQSAPVPEIGAITPNTTERDFAILAKSVREAIERNEPEVGLDRLHTFVVRYMKVLCEKHGITTDRDKPLHSMVGEYVKCLRQKKIIESEMTERILKSSISTLEAFNRVRNEHSFAHDNPVLNYEESLLIYNHVTSSVRFLEAVERQNISSPVAEKLDFIEDESLPF